MSQGRLPEDGGSDSAREQSVLDYLSMTKVTDKVALHTPLTTSSLAEPFVPFVTEALRASAVLVWCLDDKAADLRQALPDACVQDDDIIDGGILSELDAKRTTGDGNFYPLLIVTQAEHMRAVDYRAKAHGIVLVVARSFGCSREAQ